jgi:hypothetical protein
VDAEFAAAIDKARRGKSRSQFLREALYRYLATECGITLPQEIMHAPDRAGKGGRKRKSALKSVGKKISA